MSTTERAFEIEIEASLLKGGGYLKSKPEHFDPQVLECFRAHADEFARIYDLYRDA